jgi:hypothetical protein
MSAEWTTDKRYARQVREGVKPAAIAFTRLADLGVHAMPVNHWASLRIDLSADAAHALADRLAAGDAAIALVERDRHAASEVTA